MQRNALIIEDILAALEQNRFLVVLTERRDHLDLLADQFADKIAYLFILRGGMGKKQRLRVVDQLKNLPVDKPGLILATGRYLGEGFDHARLDTLFLKLPISWRGTVVQYAGRLHREHEMNC